MSFNTLLTTDTFWRIQNNNSWNPKGLTEQSQAAYSQQVFRMCPGDAPLLFNQVRHIVDHALKLGWVVIDVHHLHHNCRLVGLLLVEHTVLQSVLLRTKSRTESIKHHIFNRLSLWQWFYSWNWILSLWSFLVEASFINGPKSFCKILFLWRHIILFWTWESTWYYHNVMSFNVQSFQSFNTERDM